MAYPDSAPTRADIEDELTGFDLTRRHPYVNAMIAAVSGEMGARLRGLGLPNGDISIVDRQTQAWVNRLILVETSRRVLVALGDAETTPDAEHRIDLYRAEYRDGIQLLNDLPSDFFTTLDVIPTIVGSEPSGLARASSAASTGGLSEADIIALIHRETQGLSSFETGLLQKEVTLTKQTLVDMTTTGFELLPAPTLGRWTIPAWMLLIQVGGVQLVTTERTSDPYLALHHGDPMPLADNVNFSFTMPFGYTNLIQGWDLREYVVRAGTYMARKAFDISDTTPRLWRYSAWPGRVSVSAVNGPTRDGQPYDSWDSWMNQIPDDWQATWKLYYEEVAP